MDTILKGLQDLEGVHGAVVADPSGQVLAYRAHSVYDQNLLQEVSRIIVGALDSIKLLHEDWESVTAHFSEGKLLIRNLGAGSKGGIPPLTLFLIADSRLNPSFAGVAIRVAVSKIRALLEASAMASTSNPGSGSVSVSFASSPQFAAPPGSQQFSPAAQASNPDVSRQPTLPDVATSGLSWSGVGGSTSTMGGSGVAVADTASSAFLTTCTKQLARSVGPMAKLFVKEAVRKICPDRPFSRDAAVLLVAELEKHIDDKSEIAQFRLVLKSV